MRSNTPGFGQRPPPKGNSRRKGRWNSSNKKQKNCGLIIFATTTPFTTPVRLPKHQPPPRKRAHTCQPPSGTMFARPRSPKPPHTGEIWFAGKCERRSQTILVFLARSTFLRDSLFRTVCPAKSVFGTRLCARGRARNVPGSPQARWTFIAGSCTARRDRRQ